MNDRTMVYEVAGLVKIYPGQPDAANQDINLQVRQGEIFGLLGDNGAGKTTLVRQMANLIRSKPVSCSIPSHP